MFIWKQVHICAKERIKVHDINFNLALLSIILVLIKKIQIKTKLSQIQEVFENGNFTAKINLVSGEVRNSKRNLHEFNT